MEKMQPVRQIQRLCVFCGSSTGARSLYAEASAQLGRELVSGEVRNCEPQKAREVSWFALGDFPANLTMTARNAIQAHAGRTLPT